MLFKGTAAALAFTSILGVGADVLAAEPSAPDWQPIDWPAFLSRSDLVWQVLPDRWDRGAFTGNGLLGSMIFVDDGALSWELGRVDVVDNQPSERPMVAGPRLPIGFLRWRGCQTNNGDMRLDLWNAEVRGTVTASGIGPTKFRSWTHASQNVIGIAVSKGGCSGQFEIDAAQGISDGAQMKIIVGGQPVANPPVQTSSRGSRKYTLQRLTQGGAHVIAIDSFDAGDEWITFATVARARNAKQAMAQADQALNKAQRQGWNQLRKEHQQFWHHHYPQSFVSLPDAQLESFYWIQMYKLGSAARANGPVVDVLGPWYHKTIWPGLWWNLNVQLTYWPLYTANRLDGAASVINLLRKGLPQLRANAKPRPGIAIGRNSTQDLRSPLHIIDNDTALTPEDPREQSNLLWVLHNVWLHHAHAHDPRLHREVVALLSEAVTYNTSLLQPGEDGRLHLPVAWSPEYPEPAADTNYDLGLLTWALKTLLRPENRRFQTDSARRRWQQTLNNLAPFPINEQGLLIGRNQPLEVSHRAPSHLISIYPLGLLLPDVPADRDVIERSLAHWIGMEGGLEGYSFVIASATSSRLGKGDDALNHLSQLIRGYVRRNTMYMEAGPVIETPLAAAQAIHEMLLQNRENALFVFPALPTTWNDVVFRDLRAEGALLVSAERHKGRTTQVSIRSLAGQPVRLHLPKGSTLKPTGLSESRWQQSGPLTFDLRLRAGEVLHFVDAQTPFSGGVPVAHANQVDHPFGSRLENAWLPTSAWPASKASAPPKTLPHKPGVISWEILDDSLSTVFTQNGAEEVPWAHSSCDPCAWETLAHAPQKQAAWKPISSKAGCFDFRKLFPQARDKDVIAYVRGTLVSETEGDMDLQIGFNDQGRAWWWANANRPAPEASILMNKGGSTLGNNEARVRVKVGKGSNYVFLKTINEGGGWGACVKATTVR